MKKRHTKADKPMNLLILGANAETVRLVTEAKAVGLKTFVADPYKDSPAKLPANKSIEVDCTDIDKLEEICTKYSVDYIVVGVADSLVKPYFEICERLQYPCYATSESIIYLTNKINFNELLKKYSLKGIPGTIYQPTKSNKIAIKYPRIVKPAVSNSGKGISLTRSIADDKDAIEKALNEAKTGEILIEEYMECDDAFFYLEIINGNIDLAASADRYTTSLEINPGRVCHTALYQSKHELEFKQKYLKKIRKMISQLGVINGVLCISAFIDKRGFHFYDPGFRLQGEAPDIHIHKKYGISHARFLLDIAQSKAIHIDEYSTVNKNHEKLQQITVWVLGLAGKIEKIEGMSSERGVAVQQRLIEGDKITESDLGTERQTIARLYFWAKDLNNLKLLVERKLARIKVIDASGNNMVLKTFESTLDILESKIHAQN